MAPAMSVPLGAKLSLLVVVACKASFSSAADSNALNLRGKPGSSSHVPEPVEAGDDADVPLRALQDDAHSTTGALNWPINSHETLARATVSGNYPIKVPDVYYYVELGLERDVLSSIWSEAIATYVANSNIDPTAATTVNVMFSVPPPAPSALTTRLPPPGAPRAEMSPLTVSYLIVGPPGDTAETIKERLISPGVTCLIQEDIRRALERHPSLTRVIKETAILTVINTCVPLPKTQGSAAVAVPLGIAGGIVAFVGVFVATLCMRKRSRMYEDGGEGKAFDDKFGDFQHGSFYDEEVQDLKAAHSVVPSNPVKAVEASTQPSDADSRPVGELLMPSGPGLTAEVVQPWLENVYARHNPKNLYKVEEMLEEHKGREEDLVEAVSNKYRLEPDDFERHYTKTRCQRLAECGSCSVFCGPTDADVKPMFAQSLEGGGKPEEEPSEHHKLDVSSPPPHAPSRPSR